MLLDSSKSNLKGGQLCLPMLHDAISRWDLSAKTRHLSAKPCVLITHKHLVHESCCIDAAQRAGSLHCGLVYVRVTSKELNRRGECLACRSAPDSCLSRRLSRWAAS